MTLGGTSHLSPVSYREPSAQTNGGAVSLKLTPQLAATASVRRIAPDFPALNL